MLTLFLKEQVESSSSWFGVCLQFESNQHLFHKDSNLGLASFSAFVYLCIKRIYPLQTIQCVRCGSVLFRLEFTLRAFFRAFAHLCLKVKINTQNSLYNSYIAGQYLFASGLQIYTYISPGKCLIIYVDESWLTFSL